jgi:RNA polymerase sigma-70 factor (ECF subfamily)
MIGLAAGDAGTHHGRVKNESGPSRDAAPLTREGLEQAWLTARPVLVRFLTARTGSSDGAEDIAQDAWLKIRSLSPDLIAEIRQPQAFLYRLVANLALDRDKARRRAGARDLEWRRAHVTANDDDRADAPSAEDVAWARLKLERVVAAIDAMPARAAQAFRLHKIEGLNQADVAARMGVSRSAVEKYISASLQTLLTRVGWP